MTGLSGALHAQPPVPDPTTPTSGSDTTEPQNSGEIVVTGNKLGPNLDRAPVSVTTLDAQTLERSNIHDLQGVQVRVPSLVYNNTAMFAQAYIRGIGTNFTQAGMESAVATYVDGVYIQRQAGAVLDVVDLKSVEVLKGPQGTLYGRNATGGAILVETVDPTDKLGGFLTGEYGRFNHRKLQGAINIPLSGTLSIRVAGQLQKSDGFYREPSGGHTGETSNGLARAKVKWQPNPNFTAIYSFEYSRSRQNDFAPHERLTAPLCLVCAVYGDTPAPGFYTTTGTLNPKSGNRYYANTLRLSWSADNFTVNSVTGLRLQRTRNINDQEHMPENFVNADAVETGPTFTEDLYFRTKLSGPLNFLVGGSYEREHDKLTARISGAAFGALVGGGTFNDAFIHSYSFYGDAYYDLASSLKLTIGARFNRDQKGLNVQNDANGAIIFGSPGFEGKKSFRNVTPHAILSYDIGSGYYYASYGRGAKSGGYSAPAFSPENVLKPETLDSFEIGAKNHFFDNRLKTRLAIFYGNYSDIQVQFVDINAGTIAAENAAKAHLYGAEFDAEIVLAPGLGWAIGGAYLHNDFTKYQSASVQVVPAAGAGLASGSEDLSGTPLPRAPRFSAYSALDYSAEFGRGWKLNASITGRYTSSYYFLAGAGGPLGLDRQSKFIKVDGSMMLTVPGENFSFGPYVTNLTGVHYFNYAATSSYGAYYLAAAPREFGIRATVKY
jgi:iron complex outermembrane receptor protein